MSAFSKITISLNLLEISKNYEKVQQREYFLLFFLALRAYTSGDVSKMLIEFCKKKCWFEVIKALKLGRDCTSMLLRCKIMA